MSDAPETAPEASPSEGAAVLYEASESIGGITINRPERRNALSPEVIAGIADALRRAEGDAEIRVVVLTGAGEKAFCAGGDLAGMTSDSRVGQHFQRAELGDLLQQMRSSRLPIVAAVNGHALGGGFGLMLGCDLVIAAEDAEMGTPEINVGLWPFMITAVIQRDLPRKVALELMLTGRRMPAVEAVRWGFVNRMVPRERLPEEVKAAVQSLLSKSPVIIELGKRSFYRSEDMTFSDQLDYLAGMLTLCLETEDTIEGVSAFLEKRKPEWKGR